jgi:hypothetical protein
VATVQMQPEKLQRLLGRLSRWQAIDLAAAAARATPDRHEQRNQAVHGDRLGHLNVLGELKQRWPDYREPEESEIRRFGFEFRTSATTADDNGIALQEENLPRLVRIAP